MSGGPGGPADAGRAVPVAGLLLAAGGGRRLGMPKALVPLHGQLLVERGLAMLREGGCDPVTVVLGAAAEHVRARADLRPARIVVNPGWRQGMGTSLRTGLNALDSTVPAVAVALVDQPLVGSAVVDRLVAAWRRGAVAAVASYGGRPRNPVVLDRSLWPAVAAHADADQGARAFLRARPDVVTLVECDDIASPDDIDTPADLEAASQGGGQTQRSRRAEDEPCN